jgi:sugar lactone lactonase YvrE
MTANVLHQAIGLPIPASIEAAHADGGATSTIYSSLVNISTVAAGLTAPAGIAVVPPSAAPEFRGRLVVSLPRVGEVVAVDPRSNTMTLLAGGVDAAVKYGYDPSPGAMAKMEWPLGVAVDSTGRVYVADAGANVIRRIDTDPSQTTITLAGSPGDSGSTDGVAEEARFSRPSGIAIDASNSTLYVADSANHRIRAIDLATKVVTTIAGSSEGDADGSGNIARFAFPTGVTLAPDGRIFVLSTASRKVKMILPDLVHTVVTLAGAGEGMRDGAGSVARLSPQLGAAWVDTFLAIADESALKVRALVPGSDSATTQVFTLAFSGRSGSIDGNAPSSAIELPVGMAAAEGALYVTDGAAGTIRMLRLP